MKRVTVVTQEGKDFEETEMEVVGLVYVGERRVALDYGSGRKILDLVGGDLGQRRFHLVDGKVRLIECRIVKMASACTIEFLRKDDIGR